MMIIKEADESKITHFSNPGHEEGNVNTQVGEKVVKDAENYKLVDVLDDLYASNRAQMQRRRRTEAIVGDKAMADAMAAVDEIMAKKYPKDKEYTDEEKKAQEDERLKLQAIEQQELLDDLDLPYEQVGNLLVIGEPGGGKTSIIQDWAKQKKIGLVTITGSDIDENVTKGTPFKMNVPKAGLDPNADPDDPKNQVQVCAMLPSEFFAQLDNPHYKYTVLFVDEINRAWSEAMGALLTLVQDRTIQDRNWNLGRHKFDKYLFTIAALNPPTYDPTLKDKQTGKVVGGIAKNGANKEAKILPNALNTRFAVFYWNSDPDETRKFLDKTFDKFIKGDTEWLDNLKNDKDFNKRYGDEEEYGSVADITAGVDKVKRWKLIADTLLGNGNFRFADQQEIDDSSKGDPHNIHVLNARTLTAALMHCDGTIGLPAKNGEYPPNSFMYQFKYRCSQNPTMLKKVEYMLTPLVKADAAAAQGQPDKANSISDNLAVIYDEWKETFGKEYGISE